MMYGTDNGAACCVCGGTVKQYDVEPRAADRHMVTITCVSCRHRNLMAVDARMPIHAANLSAEERRIRSRPRRRPAFQCPSGYRCVTAEECTHWDYED